MKMKTSKLLALSFAVASTTAVAQGQDTMPATQEAAPTEQSTTQTSQQSTEQLPASSGDAPAAHAMDWDAQWGLLFGLNNIFQNSSILTGALNSGNISIGGTYFLGPRMAVRGVVNVSRSTNPELITKTSLETGADPIVTYVYNQFPTDAFSLGLRADGLMRLTGGAVAPYVGGGVFYTLNTSRTAGTNEVQVVDQVTRVNNFSQNQNIGLRGLVGGEWRVHKHFALFAEYGLDISVYNDTISNGVTTVENTVNGVRTAQRTTVRQTGSNWFNLSTGLRQGANFGLSVMF